MGAGGFGRRALEKADSELRAGAVAGRGGAMRLTGKGAQEWFAKAVIYG